MTDLILYTNPQSRGLQVMWMLEECGADYQAIAIPYGEKMKSAEYLAINPMGKVPAIKHGETVTTETAAILTYLAEQFPDKNLIPPVDSAERGQYYRWLCFAIHCEYAIMDKWHDVPVTQARSNSIGYGHFDDVIETLRNMLKGKTYLIGSQFSALDLYYAGLIGWGINRTQVLSKDDTALTTYLAQYSDRPAFKKTMAKTAEMAKALES